MLPSTGSQRVGHDSVTEQQRCSPRNADSRRVLTGLSACLLERWSQCWESLSIMSGPPQLQTGALGPRSQLGPHSAHGSTLIGHTLEDWTTSQPPGCPTLPTASSCSRNIYASWLEFLEARDLETPCKHSAEALSKSPTSATQEAKGQTPEPGPVWS